MAVFADLKPEEQALVLAFVDQLFRPVQGVVNRAFGQVQHMIDSASSGASAMLAKIDAAEPLPTTSGLAGAQPVTPGELLSALEAYAGALKSFNTDEYRQARIKSAGFSATAS